MYYTIPFYELKREKKQEKYSEIGSNNNNTNQNSGDVIEFYPEDVSDEVNRFSFLCKAFKSMRFFVYLVLR